jgi:hypothetical protein
MLTRSKFAARRAEHISKIRSHLNVWDRKTEKTRAQAAKSLFIYLDENFYEIRLCVPDIWERVEDMIERAKKSIEEKSKTILDLLQKKDKEQTILSINKLIVKVNH